jgi:hypothetical protein
MEFGRVLGTLIGISKMDEKRRGEIEKLIFEGWKVSESGKMEDILDYQGRCKEIIDGILEGWKDTKG